MAWNQPDPQKSPWGRRPDKGGTDLDEKLKDWQRRLEALLRWGGRLPRGSTLLLLGSLLVLAWFATGIFQIGAAERGVILRFGKLEDVRGEGAGVHWPWPIETLFKVNVMSVKSQEFSPMVLTADVNLVDLRFAVQYRFADPIKVLFQVRDPEITLGEVSQSALREVVGQSNLQDVLAGVTRPQVTQRTRALIQRTLDAYDSGIEVTSVNLTDVQVPDPVVPSQRDANKALADEENYIKEAQAYANRVIPEAQGKAAKIGQDAQGYAARVVDLAQGQTTRFSEIAAAYARAPAVTRERLYLETMESVLGRASKVIIDSKPGTGGNMFYLPLDKLPARAAAASPATGAADQGDRAAGAQAADADADADRADDRSRAQR